MSQPNVVDQVRTVQFFEHEAREYERSGADRLVFALRITSPDREDLSVTDYRKRHDELLSEMVIGAGGSQPRSQPGTLGLFDLLQQVTGLDIGFARRSGGCVLWVCSICFSRSRASTSAWHVARAMSSRFSWA